MVAVAAEVGGRAVDVEMADEVVVRVARVVAAVAHVTATVVAEVFADNLVADGCTQEEQPTVGIRERESQWRAAHLC